MISVIMSVYNEENYISESIQSVINQSVDDIELIIIDDCSTDKTVEIINSTDDSRIKLIVNEFNQGLTKNLNKALKLCKGEFIARMDGDDICEPDRFEKQLAYFSKHPEVDLISCRMKTFGAGERKYYTPLSHEAIVDKMLINAVMPHPGFMMRGSLIYDEGFDYDESLSTAQDYDFEVRVAKEHRLGMVPDYLLNYRLHDKQVSNNKTSEQAMVRASVRRRLLGYVLGSDEIKPTDDEMEQYNILADREYDKLIDWQLLEKLIARYYLRCRQDKRRCPKSIRREYVLRLFHDRNWNKLFNCSETGRVFVMSSLTYFVGAIEIIIEKSVKKICRIYES